MITLVIGIFIGVVLGIFISGLCVMARDEEADSSWLKGVRE